MCDGVKPLFFLAFITMYARGSPCTEFRGGGVAATEAQHSMLSLTRVFFLLFE